MTFGFLIRNRNVMFVIGLIVLTGWVMRTTLQNTNLFHFLYNSAVVGGILSGSLHALTGADHLAALLPLIFGKRWWKGSFHGMVWGLGHGLTSSAIGLLGYSMKSYLLQSTELFYMYGYVVDSAVGFTLIVIGIMGIYEGNHEENENQTEDILIQVAENVEDNLEQGKNVRSIEVGDEIKDTYQNTGINNNKTTTSTIFFKSIITSMTVFMNGCILGISWDGLPSLAPAIVLKDIQLYMFLFCYGIGTAITMSFTAGVVSETTCWINRIAKINVSERIAAASSLCAMLIGILWLISGIIKLVHSYYHTTGIDNSNIIINTTTSSSSISSSHSIHLFSHDILNDGTGYIQTDLLQVRDNGNDSLHEHALGREWAIFLSVGSLCTIVGVILYATQIELGFYTKRFLLGKPSVHVV